MTLADLAKASLGDRRNTPDLISEVLRDAIGRGFLTPGQPLSQADLAAQFGVSPIPVREALRRLEADKLVVVHHNRGAFVAAPSVDDVRELYEIRIPLETLALRLAVPLFSEPHLLKLEKTLHALDKVQDGSKWARLDSQFHELLYQPSGRIRLLELISKLRANTQLYHTTFTGIKDQFPQCQAEHRALLSHCRARDSAGASQSLEKHLSHASDRVAQALTQP